MKKSNKYDRDHMDYSAVTCRCQFDTGIQKALMFLTASENPTILSLIFCVKIGGIRMKIKRILVCVLLVLLVTLCAVPCAFAEVIFSGDGESINGEYDSTVFIAGESPVNSADVKGILFAAGNSVSSSGSGEYAFMAGNMVSLSGSVGNDAFIAGNSVSFTGSCARDLAAAGNSVDIRGTVGRDLAAGGRSVVIDGHVGGDVVLAAEEITITSDAVIEGTVRYNSSAKIDAPADVLEHAIVYEDQHQTENADGALDMPEAKKPSPLSKVKNKAFSVIGLLLIAYFLLWLTPMWEKLDRDYTGKPFGTFAGAFGIGFAVLAALPLACIILMITGFGLRPAFVLLLVYITILIAAPVFLGFFLGTLLWRKAFKQARNYWAELAVGLVVWAVLTAIPGLSFVVGLVSGALGLGVLTRLLGKKKNAVPPEAPTLPVSETNPGYAAGNGNEPFAPALQPGSPETAEE